MAEPTSAVATSMAFGVGALITAAFGVETQALVASLVGATLGVSLAPPSSKVRAVLVFIAVVLACATIGTFVSDAYMAGSRIGRNFAATTSGIVFHPMLTAIVDQLPKWLETLRAWVTPRGKGPPP